MLFVNFAKVRDEERLLCVRNMVCRELGSTKNAFAQMLRRMSDEEWRKCWKDRKALGRDDSRVGRDVEGMLLRLRMGVSNSVRIWVRDIVSEVEGTWCEGFET